MNKILHDGEIIIDKIVEMDTILFDPPVKCKYIVFEENRFEAIIEFEFGLQMNHRVDPRLNFNHGHEPTSSPPTVEEMIRSRVVYDLAHAFLHTTFDPNYLHLHWALKAWLKDQSTIVHWLPPENFDKA